MKKNCIRSLFWGIVCLILGMCLLLACTGNPDESLSDTEFVTESVTETESESAMDTIDTVENTERESLSDTESESVTEGETEAETYEVRLYSLMPESGSLMQSFVLRTKHGKLIVLDGGIDGTGFELPAYMPAALRAIAGVDQEGYVEVEAWILSHAHKDHFGELRKTLDEYTDDENFVIKNFYFDFPEYGTAEYPGTNADSPYLDMLKASLNHYAEVRGISVSEGSTYYDDLNGAYVNADSIAKGCELTIDGVRIEFLQTWKSSDGSNINNNSLVLRMWVEGQSILFLQDTATERGQTLLDTYGEALKSDIVQMAHHGQGGVRKPVYDMIDAKVRIWPTPLWVWNNTTTYEIGVNRKWVHGGEDFTGASDWDIVTSLYKNFPQNRVRVTAWARVIDGMSISLPYAAVDTAPVYDKNYDTPSDKPTGVDYRSENPVNFVGTFTNFDSQSTLTTSTGNNVFGGNVTGDLYLSNGATGTTVSNVSTVTLAEGKGYNGSTALAVKASNTSNQAFYLFGTEQNKNTLAYPDTSYLRVWVDFTDMDFRKATFGLVTKGGDLYSVGEKDFENTPIYYLPEGESTWQTFKIGNDGCFGQQEGPAVKNFKGWMAFPTEDFLWWGGKDGGAKGDVFNTTEIVGVYLFWCYAQNENHVGKTFYLDEIQLVKDYRVFEAYTAE